LDNLHISFGGKEVNIIEYEILVGNPNGVKWIDVSGEIPSREENYNGYRLVDCGRCNDRMVYAAKADYLGGSQIGKAGAGLEAAHIPYGGKEVKVLQYQVLAHA
jgi:hypothetical protein